MTSPAREATSLLYDFETLSHLREEERASPDYNPFLDPLDKVMARSPWDWELKEDLWLEKVATDWEGEEN